MEIKKLRDGQKQKEQEVRNELQTFYNKKMENVEEKYTDKNKQMRRLTKEHY